MAGREPRQAGQAERGLGPARGLGNLGSSPSPPRVAGNKVSDAQAHWGGVGGNSGVSEAWPRAPRRRWGDLGWAPRMWAVAIRNKGGDVSQGGRLRL